MNRGAEILDHGNPTSWAEAESCYRRAIDGDDRLHGAWIDLGLVHKWRKEWVEALQCNRRALELEAGSSGDPAYWNAGIAATALGDWGTARWAWTGYGVDLPDDFPFCENTFGMGGVRLPDGEVVWGTRRDPARVCISSVPLPDSGFRCGDVVLNDGAPTGSRVVRGREYPVFDVLLRLEPSPLPTVQVVVRAEHPGSVEDLGDRLARADIVAENWTESITIHCKACSEGRVDYDEPGHDHSSSDGDGTTTFGCSGELDDISQVVDEWASATGAAIDHVEVVA
jgi:hypothetical protein